MSEDSIEAEKDVTFDKSDDSVTENVPVITSKNGVPTDQHLSNKDVVSDGQLETAEVGIKDDTSRAPNQRERTSRARTG